MEQSQQSQCGIIVTVSLWNSRNSVIVERIATVSLWSNRNSVTVEQSQQSQSGTVVTVSQWNIVTVSL